jgi:putative ABC transport system permease protein
MISQLLTIVRLSLRDYLHERLLSICAIFGLAAVLAPILVLFGLKSGIINTLTDRLIRDPRNLEVTPVGSGGYAPDWFAEMARHPSTAFIVAQTRAIAANMILANQGLSPPPTLGVDIIPTAEGDPLLERWVQAPKDDMTVVLSDSAARKLRIFSGQKVAARIGRSVQGRNEQVEMTLTVAAVLPAEATYQDSIFVRLKLLEAIEAYRDGFGSTGFGWPGKTRPDGVRKYPSFRLYARTIDDVAILRQSLIDQGVEVYTRAEEIELVQNLDRSLTLIFSLIAVVAVCGYFASMASNVLANVNRKSRHLGITRLIGFSSRNMVWFPLIQAAATAVLGCVSAFFLYFITELTINALFSRFLSMGEYVCHLTIGHYLAAFAVTLIMSVLASSFAGFQAAKIEPSKVIRDV